MPAHGLLRDPTFVVLMTSAHRALRLKRVGLLKDLHAELQVVLKLLSKDPERRGESAEELLPAFTQWQRLFQEASSEGSTEEETWDRDD